MLAACLWAALLLGASARSMTPMADIAAARFLQRHAPGELARWTARLSGLAHLSWAGGDCSATRGIPRRTALSFGSAGACDERGHRRRCTGAPGSRESWRCNGFATAVPLAYITLAGPKQAMARIGQTRSGLMEDALVVGVGEAIVALAVRR